MRDEKGRFVKGHQIPNRWKKIVSKSNKIRNNSIKTRMLRSESLKKCHAEGKHSGSFKKGHKIGNRFKKGDKPWNYLDGRSKGKCDASRYGDDWFKIRLLIYRRDKFTCQECALKMTKETGAFHVHHKIPFLQSFDNSLNNLITLCPSCHRKEDIKIMKQIKGMEVTP